LTTGLSGLAARVADEQIVTELVVDGSGVDQGVAQYTSGMGRAAAATDQVIAGQGRLEESTGKIARAYNSAMGQLDPVFAATQRLNKETSTLELAVRGLNREVMTGGVQAGAQYDSQLAKLQGRIGEVRAATEGLRTGSLTASDAMKTLGVGADRLGTAHAALGKSTNAASFAMRDLGIQSIDVFQGLATGAPIMTTLIQQGAQVGQVMATSGVSISQMGTAIRGALGSALAFIISPLGLLITGAVAVTGAIVALGVAAESNSTRLAKMSLAARGVRDDFAAMTVEAEAASKTLAATTALSTTDARAITSALNQAMDFRGNRSTMVELGKDIQGLAAIMGSEIPDAAKRFTDAMMDPAKASDDLIGKVKGFDKPFADYVKGLQSAGDSNAAFVAFLNKSRDATVGATKPLTELDAATLRLEKSFNGAVGAGKSFTQSLGEPFVQMAAGIENALASVIEKLRSLGKAFPEIMSLIGTAAMQLPGGTITGLAIKAGVQAGGSPAPEPGMAIIKAPGGAQFTVAASVAPAFQGLINELETRGYLINPSDISSYRPGSTVAGTGSPSEHSAGRAIDINASRNRVGSGGDIPPDVARELAAKYGMVWGGDFRNPDPMHFGFDGKQTVPQYIDNSRLATNAGQTQYESSGVISRQLEENTRKQQIAMAALNAEQEKYNKAVGSGADAQAMDTASEAAARQFEVLVKLQGERTNILTTQQAAAKESENTLRPLAAEAGAARDLAAAYEHMRQLGEAAGTGIDRSAWATVQAGKLAELTVQANDNVRAIDLQTAAQNRLTPIIEKGGVAAEFAANREKALEDARKTSLPNTEERIRQVAAETLALNASTLAKRDNQAAASVADSEKQLERLRVEAGLIGATTEERNRELAVMQKRQELGLKLGDQATDEQQKALNAARAVADLSTQIQQQTQALNEVGNMATQAFQTVGNAITQAFIGGQGAAVNFGNVLRGVLTQILQQITQLAIINPILNSVIGGTNRTTLDQVLGALGSSSGSGGVTLTSPGGDILGTLSTGGSVVSGTSSLLQALGYKGLGEQLGLTGEGGLLTGLGGKLGLTGPNGVLSGAGSSINGALATPLWGSGATTATVGTVLGAAGGGFAAGSLVGTGVQALTDKTGPGPEIGAAIGTAIGIAAAPYTGGLSLLASALIGGVIGGAGGGLIGPGPQNAYSGTEVALNDYGRLTIGQTRGQLFDEGKERDITIGDADSINKFLDKIDVKISSIGNLYQVGQNTPGGYQDPTKFGSLASAFPDFRFQSAFDDKDLNKYLSNKSFPDFTTFANEMSEYTQLVRDIIPVLTKTNEVTGSTTDAIKVINAAYGPAIASAQKYGVSIDALTKHQEDAIQDIWEAAHKQIFAYDQQLNIRINNATGENPLGTQLYGFDIQATNEREAFTNQLVGFYGDAYKSTQEYADQMALLEKALGAERVAIQKQYNDQMTAAAKHLDQATRSYDLRYQSASAQIGNDPIQQFNAQITSVDENANQQRAALHDQIVAVYGDTANANAEYAARIVGLDRALNEERLALLQQFNEKFADGMKHLDQATRSYDLRYQSASAQIGNDPAQQFNVQLASFDENARQQRDALHDQITAVYGEGITGVAEYNRRIIGLDRALGEERLALQQQYNDKLAATATQTVVSLSNYALKLQTGAASPLSPQSQLELAQSQFNAVSGAAGAGNINSINQLPGYADSLLSASRVVNGSGAAYVATFQQVLDALTRVSLIPPDTLTSSVVQVEFRTQTQILVASLDELKTEVKGLRQQVQQNSAAPVRNAA